MASSGGLSRRRVGGGTSFSYNDDDDDTSKTRYTNGNGTTKGGSGTSTPVQHVGSALEGRSKIAHDPGDLQQDANEVLLGIKDKPGYLSFWNNNISHTLRRCTLIELALRRCIALVKDPNHRRIPITEHIMEVIDDWQMSEAILDKVLRMIKSQQDVEKLSINSWIDLLSGETWNIMKIGFQLEQVRERLAKGLVDKDVLHTEKRDFLFDMATQPVANVCTKENLTNRVVTLLTSATSAGH